VPWEWWARYEATVNHAFAKFALWSLCPYDRRITSAEVLDDVAQTHRYLATPDGRHVVNERYTDPAVFLGQSRSAGGPAGSLPAGDRLGGPVRVRCPQGRARRRPAHAAQRGRGGGSGDRGK
jgi:hypothetical protein